MDRISGEFVKNNKDLTKRAFHFTERTSGLTKNCYTIRSFHIFELMKAQYYISLLLVLFAWVLSGQKLYHAEHIGIEQGLTDLRIRCIAQDGHGFLWFGTYTGLYRYNGYELESYYSDTLSKGLPSSVISYMYLDSKRKFWICTSKGIVIYNEAENNFTRIPEVQGITRKIREDTLGNIYACSSKALYFYSRSKNTWYNLSKYFHDEEYLNLLKDVHFGADSCLYVTTDKRGFYKLNLRKAQREMILLEEGKICEWNWLMNDMMAIDKDKIMVSFLSPGVKIYNKNTNKFHSPKGFVTDREKVLWNTVSTLLIDHDGRYLMGSALFGLCEYFPQNDSIISYEKSNANPYGLNTGGIACLFEDNQKNLWIGTRDKGIFRINNDQQHIQFLQTLEYPPTAITSNNLLNTSLWFDDKIALLARSGISILDTKNYTATNIAGQPKNYYNNYLTQNVTSCFDSVQNLWIATAGIGIIKIDKTTKYIQGFDQFTTEKSKISSNFYEKLKKLPNGQLMGLMLSTIMLIDPYKSSFTSRYNNNDTLFHIWNIVDFETLQDTSILMLLSNGKIIHYDLNKKLFLSEWLYLKNHTAQLEAYSIKKDNYTETFWIVTNKGIFNLSAKGELLKWNDLHNQDKGSTIFQKFELVNDKIWLCSDNTIMVTDTGLTLFKHIVPGDGISLNQYVPGSLRYFPSGKIYLVSKDGLYQIDTGILSVIPEIHKPKVFSVMNLKNKNYYHSGNIPEIIQMAYNANSFTFNVGTLDYAHAQEIQYRYKLDGFDKEWNYMGKDRSGFYTNIDPGNYKLIIQSQKVNTTWVSADAQIDIVVSPPFWKTNWFFTTMFLLIGGILYAFMNFRERRIQSEEKLRSEYEIKLHELENSALRTQMNPHFIFNCLNTINAYIQINDRAKAGLMISRFSKLIRMILNHSRQKEISLQEELDALELYIMIEQSRFDHKFNFDIKVDNSLYPDSVSFPSLILQPFVENAILHGLLPLHAEGKLQVEIIKKENFIQCIVEDNGIGRDAAKQLRKNNAQQKSHGLDITLKRIELYNTEHTLEQQVQIVDKFDNDETSNGTKIIIPIALNYNM